MFEYFIVSQEALLCEIDCSDQLWLLIALFPENTDDYELYLLYDSSEGDWFEVFLIQFLYDEFDYATGCFEGLADLFNHIKYIFNVNCKLLYECVLELLVRDMQDMLAVSAPMNRILIDWNINEILDELFY
jgi:hypothetical protein